PREYRCSRSRDGQREAEARPLALGRVDPDTAAHGGDEPLGDEEPEPGTPSADLRDRLGPIELAEDPLLLEARDPDPLVDDANLDRVGIPARRDGHGAALGRVLDRVLDQVLEHLAHLFAIGL